GTTAEKSPNVLFIMTDDQDLHMNSLDAMPNVKSLIGEHGTTYNSHYCTVALCCPSRVSLLTGKAAHNTNVTSLKMPYVWLQEGGVNAYYVGKLMNSHSIDNYNHPFPKGWANSSFLLQPGTYDYLNNIWGHGKKKPQRYHGQNALNLIRDNSLAMLDEATKSDKPFFMAVAPAIPHLGLNASGHGTHWPVPLPKWAHSFNDKQVPRTKNFNPKNATGAGWMLNLHQQDAATVAVGDDYYRARLRALAGVDDMVADLIKALEKKGILDNTYIVYTTDNGFHIGQHRLGPGKECGIETDINIPLLMRGPDIPAGKTTSVVTTHTDMVQTFLQMLKVTPSKKVSKDFDGTAIPYTQTGFSQKANDRSEHVNVEYWGNGGTGDAVSKLYQSHIPGRDHNTYKAMRLIGQGWNLYYSVWCTGDHQLYEMKNDPDQIHNLLATEKHNGEITSHNITQVPGEINGHKITRVAERLDALLMVLKSCKGNTCIDPWRHLHPQGNVKTLSDAMETKYDDFYKHQPKIKFSECLSGYLIEAEGPQMASQYPH
ncbi:hypothetical protein N7492_010690, partial [Penicillium capsulatum]